MTEATPVTLDQVKTALADSNRIFESEFKNVAAKVAALEAKGDAVDPLLKGQLEKMNARMDELSKLNDEFISLQAAVNRAKMAGFGVSGDTSEKRALELRQFNGALKAQAMATGRQVVEVDESGYKAYQEAFDAYLRRGDRIGETEKRALSSGTDPNGGYLVTPDVSGRMVVRMFETSPMRQYSAVQVIGTDALEGSQDLEEADFGWVSELASRAETNTPKVPAPWRIPVHEAYAQPRISQKNLEDANIDVAAWLGRKVGDKIGRGYNTAFVTGNGIGKPRGAMSYTTAATADGSRSWGVFEHIATGSAGSFGTDPNGIQKLLTLIHAMKDVYTVNAGFYMNRTTLGQARQLTDASSAGKFVFIPSFLAGQPDTFLGYPVRKLQDMATYSTTDALAIAFGDMQETYQIVDRLGLTTLVDPFTAKPYVVFYTRGRVGGDVVNFESLKFLKFGTS